MNLKESNYIEIYHGQELLCKINSDSPNLEEIVSKIIINSEIDLKKLSCKSNVDSFDKTGFIEIVTTSTDQIRVLLKNNLSQFDEILKTISADTDVIEYYKKIKP